MQLKEAWDGTMKDPLVRKESFDAAFADFFGKHLDFYLMSFFFKYEKLSYKK